MHGSLLKRHIFPLVIGETLQTLPYLALGMVTANLRHYKGGLLQQGFNIERLALGGVKGHPLDTIYESVADANDPVLLLFFLCLEPQAQSQRRESHKGTETWKYHHHGWTRGSPVRW
jgi:hypothetical protein